MSEKNQGAEPQGTIVILYVSYYYYYYYQSSLQISQEKPSLAIGLDYQTTRVRRSILYLSLHSYTLWINEDIYLK